MVQQVISEMEATCAFLGCSGGGDRMAEFFERGWVVGHYKNKASFDGDDYPGLGGASQLNMMREIAESSDAYLCSLRVGADLNVPSERDVSPDQRKIGIIEPETTPMYVFKDSNSGYRKFLVGNETEAQKEFDESGADYLYKIIPLSEIKTIEGDQYRLNEYETPNTFSPWGSFSGQVRALYKGKDQPKMDPTSYTSDQTELVCAEYIRLEHPRFFPLMETGGATGTNMTVDVLGVADGTVIIGEVKNREGVDGEIIENLRQYGDGEKKAYYFCRGGGTAEGVTVVNLNSVLERLSESYHDDMLERMTTYS
jgi:hypothetical protein